MKNKPIQLTEQDLHFLVENAVQVYLTENETDEGFWGGMKNAWNSAMSGNFNLGKAYKSGNWASSFKKYADQANTIIGNMQKIAYNSGNNNLAASLNRIVQQLYQVSNSFEQNAQNAVKGNYANFGQVNNPFAQQEQELQNTKQQMQQLQQQLQQQIKANPQDAQSQQKLQQIQQMEQRMAQLFCLVL